MEKLTEQEQFYLTKLLTGEIRRKEGEIKNAYDQAMNPNYLNVTPALVEGIEQRLRCDIERAESILEKLEDSE